MSFHPLKQKLLNHAFHEVKHNEPKIVKTTRKKKGAKAAQKQKVAIALNKARQSE